MLRRGGGIYGAWASAIERPGIDLFSSGRASERAERARDFRFSTRSIARYPTRRGAGFVLILSHHVRFDDITRARGGVKERDELGSRNGKSPGDKYITFDARIMKFSAGHARTLSLSLSFFSHLLCLPLVHVFHCYLKYSS